MKKLNKMQKVILGVVVLLIAFLMIPLNLSAQSKTKRKVATKTYQKKTTRPAPGKVQLTLYCSTWINCANGYEDGITETSPIDCIRMRENNYIEFVRNDGSIWKRFYLPYKSTDIYGELSFCNKSQTIVVSTSFRNRPNVVLVTDEDKCVFFLDMDKTNADVGAF